MEPRPPRPRGTGAGERASGGAGAEPAAGARAAGAYPVGAAPEAAGYGPGGAPPGYPPVGEIPLVPRQQRRRQRLARGALGLVLLLGGLGAAGYFAADRFFGDDDDGRDAPALAVSSPAPAAQAPAASPPAEPTATSRASVAQPVPTETPDEPAAGEETPTAAAEAQPARRAAAETEEAGAGAAEAAGEPPALEDLLPAADEAPADLTQVNDPAERPVEDVITSLGSADAAERLDDLGWEANYTVQFTEPNPEALPPGSTTAIDVSIHRFADDASAAEALTYFSDQLVGALGFAEFRVDPIGDDVRALRGVNEQGVGQVVLYVQIGGDLARISGTSNTEDGDPTEDVSTAAEAVVARAE